MAAFISCWEQLDTSSRADLVSNLMLALNSPTIPPDILQVRPARFPASYGFVTGRQQQHVALLDPTRNFWLQRCNFWLQH